MRSACKKLIYFCVFPAVFLVILEYNMPAILDLIWPVTVAPTISLKAIHDLQIKLYTLEVELSQMLTYETHPLQMIFKEKLEPNLSYIESTSRAVQKYVQSYGPVDLEEIGRLIDSFTETQRLLAQFAGSFDEIKTERADRLFPLNDNATQVTGFWTRWALFKHVDYLADLHVFFDSEHDELRTCNLRSLNTSIALVETLLHEFEKSDQLINQMSNLGPGFTENTPILVNHNGSKVKVTLSLLKKLLQEEAYRLYKKHSYQFGTVVDEILMATERVQTLLGQVIVNEKAHWDQVNDKMLEKMDVITKLQEDVSSKFALNIQLRMAPRLDDDDPKEEF